MAGLFFGRYSRPPNSFLNFDLSLSILHFSFHIFGYVGTDLKVSPYILLTACL
ncbi:hypothetical protein ES703_48688 [subsurface metagenome]